MNKTVFAVAVAGLAVAVTTGCVSAPPAYRVENQRIVLGSPFALEIGSTEYAKSFGDLIHTSAHANYDPQTKKTPTNSIITRRPGLRHRISGANGCGSTSRARRRR